MRNSIGNEDCHPSQTYSAELDLALTEFLFGTKANLDPLSLTYPNVKYYVVERKSSTSGDDFHMYDAERQLFDAFWPPAIGRPQIIHLIGGTGSGKSTFTRFFFKYFLPQYEILVNGLAADSELNGIHVKDLRQHILLYADLRRCSPEADVRPYIFKKLRKCLTHEATRLNFTNDLIDSGENDEVWVERNISLLAQATKDNNRKWYISWVFDNSDQLQECQQLSLADIVLDYIPEEPSTITATERILDGQGRDLWRVIVPIRPETWLNLEARWNPFHNRCHLALNPIIHGSLIMKRASFVYEKVSKSKKNHQPDPKRLTIERADYELLPPKEMAEMLQAEMLAVNTMGDKVRVTSKEALGLLDSLVNDSARRRLNLCSRIAFSRSFTIRKSIGIKEKWDKPVSPFYFFEGLIRGTNKTFDFYESPILNLYNLGQQVENFVPFSIFVGLYSIYLANQGKQWANVRMDLAKIGHSGDDLEICKMMMLSKELMKELWNGTYHNESSIIQAHWALLKERAYTDNMAEACASSWGFATTIPSTDPQDHSQVLQRIKNSIWFINMIWNAEKHLVEYSSDRFHDFDNIEEFAAYRKKLNLPCITHYIAVEYKLRIARLTEYKETNKVIQMNIDQWNMFHDELDALINESGNESSMEPRQA